jgi:hypothetical protein
VARFEHANWIEFTSDRFDHTSELPEDYNAGNRFYGRDLAAFLCDRLNEKVFDLVFGDEDWGWLVDGFAPDGRSSSSASTTTWTRRRGTRPTGLSCSGRSRGGAFSS